VVWTRRELILAAVAGALALAVAALLGVVLFRRPAHQPAPAAAVVRPSTVRASSPPTMTRTLRTEYSVVGRWADGFNAELVLTNLGSEPVEGWTVRLGLPAGVKVAGAWSAELDQAGGAVILRSQPYNTYVAPGAAVHLGFAATGPPVPPTSCTVNGAPC
jgi:cellulase/cellobiase CelA1